MAGLKSSYLRSRLLKHALGVSSFTMPAGAYLALYTSDPTVADTGTEVTGGSYARQAITFGTEANGIISNSSALAFSNMPSCTVTHWGVRDASSGGNLLYFGQLDLAVQMIAGDPFPVNIGNLVLSEA